MRINTNRLNLISGEDRARVHGPGVEERMVSVQTQCSYRSHQRSGDPTRVWKMEEGVTRVPKLILKTWTNFYLAMNENVKFPYLYFSCW